MSSRDEPSGICAILDRSTRAGGVYVAGYELFFFGGVKVHRSSDGNVFADAADLQRRDVSHRLVVDNQRLNLLPIEYQLHRKQRPTLSRVERQHYFSSAHDRGCGQDQWRIPKF